MFKSVLKPSRELFRGKVITTTPTIIRYCTVPHIAKKRILVGSAVAIDIEESKPDKPLLIPFTKPEEVIAGFSVYNPQIIYELDDFGNQYYPIGSRVSVAEVADIVVYSETPVLYNQPLLTRVEEGILTENQIIGNVSDGTPQLEGFLPVAYSRFVEMTPNPGLAIARVNIVGI